VNTRRAVALLREIAALDEEAARLAQERAQRARALAEALEDPEEPMPDPRQARRLRGRGVMLLPPSRPTNEIDQKCAPAGAPRVRRQG
jgi:hypothetical protein